MITDDLSDATQQYFSGERFEVSTILVGCAVFIGAALALYLSQRDGFSKAFLITIFVGAIIFGSASIAILKRD